TLTYASFGLQNCTTDMEQFLTQNTYDHGYIYQETVDYDSELGYYYLPSETTVMTILPDGVYRAVWKSDYDEAGEMNAALTYTQQDAIDDAVAASEDASCATLTWTGGGTDEENNVLDGGVAIGYNYNALHLLYGKVTEPGLDKTIQVNEVGVDHDDVAAGDDVEFQLESTVPDALSDYISDSYDSENGYVGVVDEGATYILTFHDELNEALALDEDSIKVTIGSTELGEEYYSVATTGLSDSCSFEIEMDLLALYAAGIIDESDFGITAITVTYTATLDENASAGTYENTAWVSYPETESEKDKVEVDTYGIRIYKYDQSTYASNSDASPSDANSTGLSGAIFGLYSDSSAADEYLIATLTTEENGTAIYEGLDAGTYYLKETSAPEGYVASGTIQTVIISTGSGTDNIVTVNFANAPIPSTGGMGTRMYLIGGACLIAAAGTVFVISHRKKDRPT
ncbi:MAG: isopeptide-forming domain-containing fimbrial protein, partial [Clostridiales bacterium]|nr:isopeptide-forming domain-containing fimbrial protein [Clostridiales bacterium]